MARQGDSKRPYIGLSIDRLEALFTESRFDRATLEKLDAELSLRNRPRAILLREAVRSALDDAPPAEAAPPPSPASKPAAPAHKPAAPAGKPRKPATLPPATSTGAGTPASIVDAWIALEALDPHTFRKPEDLADGDRRRVAMLDDGAPLPWETGERSRPKMKLFYLVVLGAILMDRATDQLVRVHGEGDQADERRSRQREKAAIAAVLVDRTGRPVETDEAVTVCSFAWALPRALDGDLRSLGSWPDREGEIVEALGKAVRKADRSGKPLPLDKRMIEAAHRRALELCGLSSDLVEPPGFVIRAYQPDKASTPPEPVLLNSFFLRDLARVAGAVRAGAAGGALDRYLGRARPATTRDLLTDKEALEALVAPAAMPHARWPAKQGHALVMLQQAAVNAARSELAGAEGLVAVNGPPGTGKTTLLRDIVAAVVLDRARAMAAFDDPAEAFTDSGEALTVGNGAFLRLHRLDDSLKGHEILVASSNNKAVENISTELPGCDAVAEAEHRPAYLRTLGDLVHARQGKDGAGIELGRTWGLIAAVLGNGANRNRFKQRFWWDKDRGLSTYLRAVRGDDVSIREAGAGGAARRRQPTIVEAEKPPGPDEARRAWMRARGALIALDREIGEELASLERLRRDGQERDRARRRRAELDEDIAALEARRPDLAAEVERARAEEGAAADEAARRSEERRRHRKRRPGLLARLLRKPEYRDWAAVDADLRAAEDDAALAQETAEGLLARARRERDGIDRELSARRAEAEAAAAALARLDRAIAARHDVPADRRVDAALLGREPADWNRATPWLPDELQAKRERLFALALEVHKHFIDAAAPKLLHSLGAMMVVLDTGTLPKPGQRALLGDLWSTLFLVVPVLSSTFASMDRMMGALPRGSIGWLLVDEAGQAVPQAAAGALARARRAVVVGDPLQIPPVVSMSDRLTTALCRHFDVDPDAWAAPAASAQTLADRASAYRTSIHNEEGERIVGMPLLVHRRCDRPMFDISNEIAYAGNMVHATEADRPSPVGAVLGPSGWIDVEGAATAKWSPAEGAAAIDLLERLGKAGLEKPDVFLITPFRVVASELRRQVTGAPSCLPVLDAEPRAWAMDRIGTIHTFQGREADAVILVLGAPDAAQAGARRWAAGTPNILNVAVSRAKNRLYVIGSRAAWGGVGHAATMADHLPPAPPLAAPLASRGGAVV
ncbi:MAG: DEAD/DEAH box helicase [Azospirillaceae bacterium]